MVIFVKEEVDEKIKPLKEDVKLLGEILGNVIIERAGYKIFDVVERVRKDSISRRLNGTPDIEKIYSIIKDLQLHEKEQIVRAFSIYFKLINEAEDIHRIRRKKFYNGIQSKPLKGSLKELELFLKENRIPFEKIKTLLEKILIHIVFTSHPTQAERRTTLFLLRRIFEALYKKENGVFNLQEFKLEARKLIDTIWLTEEMKLQEAEFEDEVLYQLFYIENVLFDVIPDIVMDLKKIIYEYYGKTINFFPFRFSSWVGVDRDGNPYINPLTFEYAYRIAKEKALNKYLSYLNELWHIASFNIKHINNKKLLESIEKDHRKLKIKKNEKFLMEPLRVKIYLVEQKLKKTLNFSEFLEDVEIIYESWPGDKSDIEKLYIAANTFGPTFFKFNIREDANYIRKIFDEISKKNGITLQETINAILEGKKLKIPNGVVDDEKKWFEKISYAIKNDGAVESIIISNSESCMDLLGVLALMRLFKFKYRIKIVPLFESRHSLENCNKILDELFKNNYYRSYLSNGLQEVMIGYSDSTKESGFFTSNLLLYEAQKRISNVCKKNGIDFIIFHGRGGTIGRGGGPTHLAIQSLPKEAGTKLKFTEQGEVIHSKYSNFHIAYRNIESLLTGLIKREFTKEYEFREEDMGLLRKISKLSYERYRILIEHKNFFEFFKKITPLEWITKFRIGIRPPTRTGLDFKSLRAIPYVFSWNQIRMTVPGWFGFGYAYMNLSESEKNAFKNLYTSCGFIKSVIDLVEMSVAKSDLSVFEFYAKNLLDNYDDLIKIIVEEYNMVVRSCSSIKGCQLLDENPVLKRSINLRNPYVDPMHIIQVDGMKNKCDILVYRTLNGISSALRNTG